MILDDSERDVIINPIEKGPYRRGILLLIQSLSRRSVPLMLDQYKHLSAANAVSRVSELV